MASPALAPVVVGVSGASGMPYALDLLRALREARVEVHLVATRGALKVLRAETDLDADALFALAHRHYPDDDLAAPIASGSFATRGMAVVPASQTTLAKIAAGIADNLLTRAAFVHLKERRPLVLVPRETPLALPALRSMLAAAEAGAVVLPACPGFYHRPRSVEDLLRFVTQRILDHLGVALDWAPRWEG